MSYEFYLFRSVDKMNTWVNQMALQGFFLEWVNSYWNNHRGEVEHLVCVARENEQGELVERHSFQSQ